MSPPKNTETAYEVADVRGVPTLFTREAVRRSKTVKFVGARTARSKL